MLKYFIIEDLKILCINYMYLWCEQNIYQVISHGVYDALEGVEGSFKATCRCKH